MDSRFLRVIGACAALALGWDTWPAVSAAPQAEAESVATAATGRVVFCVAHNAIIVAATGGQAAGSLLPAVIPVSSERIGVLLGAVKWASPDSGGKAVRFDADLPDIAASSTRRVSNTDPNEPSEIEDIGIGLLEPLRQQVNRIHHKLALAADEPIVELLLADYVENYGPEIWSLQYHVRQENFGNDYWETTLLRPAYYQLYPPEKDHRILVEVQYPHGSSAAQPTLAERLAEGDPQLEPIRDSQDFSQVTAAILASDSKKAAPDDAADFLRTALPIVAGGQAKLVVAKLDAIKGFQWLLPPPPDQALPAPSPIGTQPTDPGAPSLRKYIPPQN